MNVKDLIKCLEIMPQNAEARILYDGEPRSDVFVVWLARSGKVILSGNHETIYSDESKPAISPDARAMKIMEKDS